MIPKFICVGFQKCGTTTLWDILKTHPGIILPSTCKEPMYYRKAGWSMFGTRGYSRRYFPGVDENDPRLPGEINAGLGIPGAAKRLSRDFPPDTKFIFMMRQPTQRAYSAYKYFLARGFLPMEYLQEDVDRGHALSFAKYTEDVLGDPEKRSQIREKHLKYLVFSEGNYATEISRYLTYFPKENMHFILFEEFIKDQKGVCRKLYEFLGIRDDPAVTYGIKSNEGNLAAYTPGFAIGDLCWMATHYFLNDFANIQAWTPAKFVYLEHLFTGGVNHYCLRNDPDRSKMLPRTRSLIDEYYRDEIKMTEQIIGRSLEGIWYK